MDVVLVPPQPQQATRLIVRPSRPDDRAAIYDTLMTSGLFGKADADCVDEMFTETWRALAANPKADTYRWLSCMAQVPAPLAGFACFGTESLTHGTWDLFWVCVRPEARGKGVARALMQEAVAQAKAEGGRLMVIYTSSTKPYAPARALYESQGFGRTAVVPEYYNVGDDLYIYSKGLGNRD
jgi:ribosomal protein S18 acetylase RimI-like enzyme